jgi:hypothetical protein
VVGLKSILKRKRISDDMVKTGKEGRLTFGGPSQPTHLICTVEQWSEWAEGHTTPCRIMPSDFSATNKAGLLQSFPSAKHHNCTHQPKREVGDEFSKNESE